MIRCAPLVILFGTGRPGRRGRAASFRLPWLATVHTEQYMGVRITRDWRHIAIAISKKHARHRGAAKPDFEDDDDSSDDAENYETSDDLAAGHSTKTGNNYGVTIDVLKRLTTESLEVFGQVSYRWHKFLGCNNEVRLRR